MENENKRAYSEVIEILKWIDDEKKLEALPIEMLQVIKSKADHEYKPEISKDDLNFVKNLEDLGRTKDVKVPRVKKKSVEEEMADLISKTEGMLESGKSKFKVDTLEGFKEQGEEEKNTDNEKDDYTINK